MPSWVGAVQVLPAWFLGFQLGVCWARGQVSRREAWLLVVVGAGIFATMQLAFDYPVSMVGAPGDARNNSNPASLLVPALALVQSGAAILLRDRVERLMRRSRNLWAAVAMVNLCGNEHLLLAPRRDVCGQLHGRAGRCGAWADGCAGLPCVAWFPAGLDGWSWEWCSCCSLPRCAGTSRRGEVSDAAHPRWRRNACRGFRGLRRRHVVTPPGRP